MTDLVDLLKEDFADATDAEITRFALGYGKGGGRLERRKRAAAARLEAYLDWRKKFELDKEKSETGDLSDSKTWEYAVNKAWDVVISHQEAIELTKKLEAEAKLKTDDQEEATDYDKQMEEVMKEPPESKEEETEGNDDNDDDELPPTATIKRSNIDQVLFRHQLEGKSIRDKGGHTILHVLPSRIDRKVASAIIYANAFAFYLDMNLDRNSDEKITIFLDVRGGEGFPNPSPKTMLKFISTVSRVLEFNFPERLEKLIIFPVPMLARGVFQPIKLLMHGKTVNKIELISGSANRHAALPKAALEKFIDSKVLDKTEAVRLGCFKLVDNK
ncbi:unnamed protein product [Cylindrotheca closterium]|uniref:CRAL-TRIO domain-containing protein n=1 Tax=Cylindrotheca closterium TaxID=2856 RepID=A0AAD2FK14_9STRA|nr:unnamed protein product [Cylindrotheca closterium]